MELNVPLFRVRVPELRVTLLPEIFALAVTLPEILVVPVVEL